MSIKSQTPGIASDMPLMSKQRGPNYVMNRKPKGVKMYKGDIPNNHVNNISGYVEENLRQNTAKPRGGEHR